MIHERITSDTPWDEIKPMIHDHYISDIGDGHCIQHIKRVYTNAMYICDKLIESGENDLNVEAVIYSALFHDCTRHLGGQGHELSGANKFGDIAKLYIPHLSDDQIRLIKICIIGHRRSAPLVGVDATSPEISREVSILRDADYLDALGPIGISRCLMYGNTHNLPIFLEDVDPKDKYDGVSTSTVNHLFEKFLSIDTNIMETPPGKNLAEQFTMLTFGSVKDILQENNASKKWLNLHQLYLDNYLKRNED